MKTPLSALLVVAFLISFVGMTGVASPGDSPSVLSRQDDQDRRPLPGNPSPPRNQKCTKTCKRYECCEWGYGPTDRPICKKECCVEYIERCE